MSRAKQNEPTTTQRVEYSSNNSGGHWWLTDQNWQDLEKAGWYVIWGRLWFCRSKYETTARPATIKHLCPQDKCEGHRRFESAAEISEDARWLESLARAAIREGLSMADAIAEWERITGANSAELGCSCCGPPHSFSSDDEYYSPSAPALGSRYEEKK